MGNLIAIYKGNDLADHFLCRRCGERVERGMFNTTPHMVNECELRDVAIWRVQFDWTAPVSNRRIKPYHRREIIDRVVAEFPLEFPRLRRPVRILLIRRATRAADVDSAAVGGKYFIDRLTQFGVIGDDRPINLGGHVKVEYKTEVGDPATIIEIHEMPGEELAPGVEKIFEICEFGAYQVRIENELIKMGMDRKQATAAIKAARLCGLRADKVLSKPKNIFYHG